MDTTLPSADPKDQLFERSWSLRVRLLLFVTVALLPIAIFSILQGIERAQADVASIHERLIKSAQNAASSEENILASAEQITRAIANIRAVRNATPGCDTYLSDALIGVSYFSNLARLDKNGVVVCSALPTALGTSAGELPIFKQARRTRQFLVSGEIQSPVLHRPVIAGMLPLYSASDKFNGTLTIALDVNWLERIIESSDLSDGAVVFVYDSKGHVLAASDAAVAGALANHSKPGDAEGSLRYGQDKNGSDWTFAAAPLHGDSMSVAFAMRRSNLFGATYLHVGADFLMPIIMIGLAWAGIWLAAENVVTRWIAYLRRFSAAYRSGHYSIRPQLEGAPREFRSLGEGLAEMAASIQDRDRRLRDALEQKSILIREIHHRVKNNLQIVMSLLSLQAGRLHDRSARDALMQAQVRINALALVHRILHEIEDMTTVDLKRLLHELTEQIAEGMRHENSRVRIQENVVSRTVQGDLAVPLALFVVENLTNIFKYAFPPGYDGQISLTLAPETEGKLSLTICDNGIGFDSNASSPGLGGRLIGTFGSQVGGTSTVCSTPGTGTRVELIFNDPAVVPAA
jgi:two-component sensor histidine kinase